MSPTRIAPREVNYEDVDDVIGIAAEMEQLDADRISVEDLQEVASDLEIPAQYVEPAVRELRRRRAALLAAEARRKTRRMWLLGLASALVASLVIIAGVSGQRLQASWHEVQRLRAQVVNVMERQVATRAMLADVPADEAKRAELAGAENRVRIERRRYDQGAAAYNARAAGFPERMLTGLLDLPETVPLAPEVTSW